MAKIHSQIVMRPKTAQSVTVSGTSAQSSAFGTGISVISMRLTGATGPAYFVLGSNPTATTSDHVIGVDERLDISVHPGEKVAVIGTDGTLKISEMTQ